MYRRQPVLYAEQVLGVTWWQKQQEIAAALLKYRRVLVKASHSVGKSHVAAGLVNWHFDCWNPGLTLSTAPTGQQVVDVLWKEIRSQRKGRPGLQPKAPRMETSAEHFAVGYTARDDNAFQGRHAEHVLIIFDEATGIEAPFWDAAEGMMTSEHSYWLCILNPTDTSSRAYEEELKGKFHVITVSALDHPNIAAELAGLPAPFPAAVRLAWVRERFQEWCDPVPAGERRAIDIEFPPGSGIWYRPGSLAESRMLGRWPTQGAVSVWTEALWNACLQRHDEPQEPVIVGCDVARFGDDFTSFIVRRGSCVLWHETHNGWSTVQTAGRLKALATEHARGQDPRKVALNIDDDGVGGGVVDILRADKWNVVPVNGASTPRQPEDYPNKRSENWFVTANRANSRELDLSRLPAATLSLLRRQLMAPTYRLDERGRRVVESKADTKKRIGRSPDDADALNLAFAAGKQTVRFLKWE